MRSRVARSGKPALGLTLVPNPSRTTALGGAWAGAAVQVFDMLGRRVLTAAADASATVPLMLPASLPAGLCLVRNGAQVGCLAVE